MKTQLTVELPPIAEAWREVSALTRYPKTSWTAVRRREERAGRTLKSIRTLVSLEEVFGRGLLERFNRKEEAK